MNTEKETILVVTLQVKVIHNEGTDPEIVCHQATFDYDDADAAIAEATVTRVKKL